MLDTSIFKEHIKEYMEPVFLENGFKGKTQGGGRDWSKPIEDGEYLVGIGFFTDLRNKLNPEYRFQLFIDPEDIRDIRAYTHSGWPPRDIQKSLGIHASLGAKIQSMGYDAWIPWPKNDKPDPEVYKKYANYLIEDLYSRIEKGKKWTKKTHRWEYKDK